MEPAIVVSIIWMGGKEPLTLPPQYTRPVVPAKELATLLALANNLDPEQVKIMMRPKRTWGEVLLPQEEDEINFDEKDVIVFIRAPRAK